MGFLSQAYSASVPEIIKNKCVECHRTGEVAPMSFESYENIRPWAKSILKEIDSNRMPPWYASPEHGSFQNDISLTEEEKITIREWIQNGSPKWNTEINMTEGMVDGWRIGTPDVVFEMNESFEVPAEGEVDYKYYRIPTNFNEDKWISALEARPGNRSVVHHIIVFVVPHGDNSSALGPNAIKGMIGGYAPGLDPVDCRNREMGTVGIRIPANSDIILQVHYTPNGEEATDRSKVGLIFSDEVPEYTLRTDVIPNFSFRIPPNDPNFYVKSSKTFNKDVQIVSLMPHMHLRGKDFKYTLIREDGTQEVLLDIPKYDFNWQISYILENPVYIRTGDRIVCDSHYDNSTNNPANPDPSKEVRWGDQTSQEMNLAWLSIIEPNEDIISSKVREELPEIKAKFVIEIFEEKSQRIDALITEQRELLGKISKK
jgi:hypothetical protein